MATISSHILNPVDGTHADGVQVDCARVESDGTRTAVFSVESGPDGRIGAEVDTSADAPDCEYELAFHTGAYFDANGPAENARPIRSLIFRVKLPADDGKFHIPVIAAPHGYSVWWSK